MTTQQIGIAALILFIILTTAWMTWYGVRVGNNFEFNKNNK
jgi:hypothetical protein